MKKRKVFEQSEKLKEIHYEVENDKNEIKKFYGVAFKNNSENSFEISSPYWKGCLGKKDFTLIKNNSKNVIVFEAFFDYLSFLQLNFFDEFKSDYLILNSVTMVNKSLSILQDYKNVFLLMDNDFSGDNCTKIIMNSFPNSKDLRTQILQSSKDVNEFHVNSFKE